MSNPITDALAKVEELKVISPPFIVKEPSLPKEVVETKIDTPTVIEVQELTTQQKLDEAQEYLANIISRYNKLEKEIKSIQQIINELAVQAELENPKETNQDAISGYLASKNKSLEDRAHRIKLITESGIQLKDLAQNLRSPIDARLSRKSKKR